MTLRLSKDTFAEMIKVGMIDFTGEEFTVVGPDGTRIDIVITGQDKPAPTKDAAPVVTISKRKSQTRIKFGTQHTEAINSLLEFGSRGDYRTVITAPGQTVDHLAKITRAQFHKLANKAGYHGSSKISRLKNGVKIELV